jgi:hypothetical protein
MIGIPPAESIVYTFIGTGLTNPTQVRARSTGGSLEILDVVKPGDGAPQIGAMYNVDSNCLWKPEAAGPF